MAKLFVMKFHQNMMSVLGIYQHPYASSSLSWLRSFSSFVVIISLILSDTFSIMYVYQEPVLSFKLESIALLIGATDALLGYLNLKWKADEAYQLNRKIQEIVDQGKNFEFSSVKAIWHHFFCHFLQPITKNQ